ncbi:MAG: hypothetical protein GF350_07995, partial [Chitinivibrionales bacterium]|nr:hypothetical protein [Chitinivibrionales bacterium]
MNGGIHDFLLLCCSIVAIISELIALVIPDKVLSLVDQDPGEIRENGLMLFLG